MPHVGRGGLGVLGFLKVEEELALALAAVDAPAAERVAVAVAGGEAGHEQASFTIGICENTIQRCCCPWCRSRLPKEAVACRNEADTAARLACQAPSSITRIVVAASLCVV